MQRDAAFLEHTLSLTLLLQRLKVQHEGFRKRLSSFLQQGQRIYGA